MTGKDINFDKELWKAADILRGNVAANEYRDIVLGLVFLKYLSDSFSYMQEKIRELCKTKGNKLYTEDPEEIENELMEKNNYAAENISWVPNEATWSYLENNQGQPDIGLKINKAMQLIERENKEFKGLLPQKYLMQGLDARNLGQLITLLTNITAGKDKDFLGRVYEYYMSKFAERGGSKGGEFFTPSSVVKLLVEMLAPYKGRIFDPACGSGGMFVQSIKFIEAHQGKSKELSIFGQENIEDYVKLCKMNLAIRGVKGEINMGNSYHNDKFKNLKADFVIANPPFNDKQWGQERVPTEDSRFKYGVVPDNNANYMWVQHFISHLSNNGLAGFVMSNGSLSAGKQEGEIRKSIVENDLVDCIVSLTGQLFYTTPIPACLWFISKNKLKRKGQTLFIDARNIFNQVTRAQRSMDDEQIKIISNIYHNFKLGKKITAVDGLYRVASLNTIRKNDYSLTPGRYVGVLKKKPDKEKSDNVEQLFIELLEHFKNAREIESRIKLNMTKLSHDS